MSQKSTETEELSTTEGEVYEEPFNGELYIHFTGKGNAEVIAKTYDDLRDVLIQELGLELGSCRFQIYHHKVDK